MHIASGDLWAGAEVQLFTLVKSLHETFNIPVTVILLNHGQLEEYLRNTGIAVIVINESSLGTLSILYRLVRVIREQKPDIIHSHRIKENILGGMAAIIAGRLPSLRTIHGMPEYSARWWQFHKQGIRFVDWVVGRYLQSRIITVSDDMAASLRSSYPQKKLRIIENGIDADFTIRQAITGEDRKEAHNDLVRIGIAGRLVPVKRVDLFIRIARCVRDKYPNLNVEYHVYGDGPMRASLEKLSKDIGVDNILHFHGHSNNILTEIGNLDVLMMTSDHEGLPMVLLEAMTLKTAVIAHAVGGIPRLLDNGSCGVLVKDNVESAYASEIYRIATKPQLVDDITQYAYMRVTKTYSADRNASAYLSEYMDINSKHGCKQSV